MTATNPVPPDLDRTPASSGAESSQSIDAFYRAMLEKLDQMEILQQDKAHDAESMAAAIRHEELAKSIAVARKILSRLKAS